MKLRFATREELILYTGLRRSLNIDRILCELLSIGGYTTHDHRVNFLKALIGKCGDADKDPFFSFIANTLFREGECFCFDSLNNDTLNYLKKIGLSDNDINMSKSYSFVVPFDFVTRDVRKKEKNFIEKDSPLLLSKKEGIIIVKESFKSYSNTINEELKLVVDKQGNFYGLNNDSKIIDKELYDKYK